MLGAHAPTRVHHLARRFARRVGPRRKGRLRRRARQGRRPTVRSGDAEAWRGARPGRAAAEEPAAGRALLGARQAGGWAHGAGGGRGAPRLQPDGLLDGARAGRGRRGRAGDVQGLRLLRPHRLGRSEGAGARDGESGPALPGPGRAPAGRGWLDGQRSAARGAAGGHRRRAAERVARVRPGQPADAAMLAELGGRLFHDAFARDNTPADMRAYLAQHFTEAAAGGASSPTPPVRCWCSRTTRCPIGWALLVAGTSARGSAAVAPAESSRPGAAGVPVTREVEIRRFYVDGRHHGGDAAMTLMLATLARARALGAGELWLAVWERNAPRAGLLRQARLSPGRNPGVPVRQRHPDRRRAVPAALLRGEPRHRRRRQRHPAGRSLQAASSGTRPDGARAAARAAHARRRGAARLGRPAAAGRGDAAGPGRRAGPRRARRRAGGDGAEPRALGARGRR